MLPEGRRRAGMALVALVLAELVEEYPKWHFLREWEMRESIAAQEWIRKGIEKGIEKGDLLQAQRTLRMLVGKRFGEVPVELDRRIEATTDSKLLDQEIARVFEVVTALDLLKSVTN